VAQPPEIGLAVAPGIAVILLEEGDNAFPGTEVSNGLGSEGEGPKFPNQDKIEPLCRVLERLLC
jgi:hypothetical protein